MAAAEQNSRWLVLEVDTDLLDSFRLRPDEDWIAWCLNVTCPDDSLEKRQRSAHHLLQHNLAVRHLWGESLLAQGTCGHAGMISAKAIRRYATLDPTTKEQVGLMLKALDPSITVLNYRLMGEFYRTLTAWFFGDVAAPAQPFAQDPNDAAWLAQWADRTGIAVKEVL
jgi:hypothetical protein